MNKLSAHCSDNRSRNDVTKTDNDQFYIHSFPGDHVSSSTGMLTQSARIGEDGVLTAKIIHEICNYMMIVVGNLCAISGKKGEQIMDKLLHDYSYFESAAADGESRQSAKEFSIENNFKVKIKNMFKSINEANNGANQVISIINDYKMRSAASYAETIDVDINNHLDFIITMFNSINSDKLSIRKDFLEIPSIRCSREKIGQVFMNILLNAEQSIASEGTITVATRHVQKTNSDPGDCSWIEVIFSDTGCGIPEDALERIFEPYFSTKSAGRANGLGLHISNEIIRGYGGSISVQSTEGKGTCVTVKLPVIAHADPLAPGTCFKENLEILHPTAGREVSPSGQGSLR